jgi:hypothetical protein
MQIIFETYLKFQAHSTPELSFSGFKVGEARDVPSRCIHVKNTDTIRSIKKRLRKGLAQGKN